MIFQIYHLNLQIIPDLIYRNFVHESSCVLININERNKILLITDAVFSLTPYKLLINSSLTELTKC